MKENCPVGQYMPQDGNNQCTFCLPKILYLDRKREVDLALNSANQKGCPSATRTDNVISTSCLMQNLMDFSAKPITLADCKIPKETLKPKTLYKLTVSFTKNGVLSKETQELNMITYEDNFKKPSCELEGFKDTIMLEENLDHRINLKVFEPMESQLYRWSCTPVLDSLTSGQKAVCPFETSPVSLNPQMKILSKDYNPPGVKFQLTLSMLRDNTNIIEKCSVFV